MLAQSCACYPGLPRGPQSEMQDVDAANYVLVNDALAGLELHVTLVNADIENTKTNMHTRILYHNTHVSEIQMMMMPFICSFRNKNEPAAIYPLSGYSPPRNKEAHVMMRPP